jgi:hypothetical protein
MKIFHYGNPAAQYSAGDLKKPSGKSRAQQSLIQRVVVFSFKRLTATNGGENCHVFSRQGTKIEKYGFVQREAFIGKTAVFTRPAAYL